MQFKLSTALLSVWFSWSAPTETIFLHFAVYGSYTSSWVHDQTSSKEWRILCSLSSTTTLNIEEEEKSKSTERGGVTGALPEAHSISRDLGSNPLHRAHWGFLNRARLSESSTQVGKAYLRHSVWQYESFFAWLTLAHSRKRGMHSFKCLSWNSSGLVMTEHSCRRKFMVVLKLEAVVLNHVSHWNSSLQYVVFVAPLHCAQKIFL